MTTRPIPAELTIAQQQQIITLQAERDAARADAAHWRARCSALADKLQRAQDKADFYMGAFCAKCEEVRP